MSLYSRRGLIAAVLALSVAAPALAEERLVPLGKVFPFLDAYLAIPAANRSKFVMNYYIAVAGKPATGLNAFIVLGGQRTPMAIASDGRVLRTPTLAELKAKGQLAITAPPKTRFSIAMSIEPAMRPAADMDAVELAAAVSQAGAGAKKAAGLMGFAVPKLNRVYFKDGAGGQLVLADGRRLPLATVKTMQVFDPLAQPTARRIVFTRAPTRMFIGGSK